MEEEKNRMKGCGGNNDEIRRGKNRVNGYGREKGGIK